MTTETKLEPVTDLADVALTVQVPREITPLERQKIRAALDLARRAFDLRPKDENDAEARRWRDRLYLAGVDVAERPNRHDRRARAAGAEIAGEHPSVTPAERELLAAVGPVIGGLAVGRLTGDVRVRAQATATARALMATQINTAQWEGRRVRRYARAAARERIRRAEVSR